MASRASTVDLATLPNELLCRIGQIVGKECWPDLLSLRNTCRQLGDILAPIIFRSITIKPHLDVTGLTSGLLCALIKCSSHSNKLCLTATVDWRCVKCDEHQCDDHACGEHPCECTLFDTLTLTADAKDALAGVFTPHIHHIDLAVDLGHIREQNRFSREFFRNSGVSSPAIDEREMVWCSLVNEVWTAISQSNFTSISFQHWPRSSSIFSTDVFKAFLGRLKSFAVYIQAPARSRGTIRPMLAERVYTSNVANMSTTFFAHLQHAKHINFHASMHCPLPLTVNFGQSPNLTSLEIGFCFIVQDFVSYVAGHTTLTHLRLMNCVCEYPEGPARNRWTWAKVFDQIQRSKVALVSLEVDCFRNAKLTEYRDDIVNEGELFLISEMYLNDNEHAGEDVITHVMRDYPGRKLFAYASLTLQRWCIFRLQGSIEEVKMGLDQAAYDGCMAKIRQNAVDAGMRCSY